MNAVWKQKKKNFKRRSDYKKMDDKIKRECRLINENWRNGKFLLTKAKQRIPFSPVVSMAKDYILAVQEREYPRSEFHVLKRHSLVTKWVSWHTTYTGHFSNLRSLQKGRLMDRNGKDWHIYYAQIIDHLMVFGGEGLLRIINARTMKEVSQSSNLELSTLITHFVE